MNRFFSLLSVVLLYCSTISAQLIKIDYNNPLWSFDYMREAWKNNMDFLEAEHRIQIDSTHVNQKFRDYLWAGIDDSPDFQWQNLREGQNGFAF
ncbi:hypothetical protein H6B28_17420 [Bacteroides mediterraneensis]|nr:hypothetical protein [Bacteroides mediterraneensis]